MAEQVTIKSVWDKPPRDYSFELGGNTIYLREYVFTSMDGRFIAFSQKPESDPPTDGLVLEFDQIVPPPQGKKLWKGKKPKRIQHSYDYTGNGAQTSTQPALQPVGHHEVVDITQRLIIRQNALNRALDYTIWSKEQERFETDDVVSLQADTIIEARVDYFERLIWEAASKGHELKVMEWAGVVPAKREETSTDPSAQLDAPTSRSAGTSTGEGQIPPERQPDGSVPAHSPEARPTDGGVGLPAPSSDDGTVLIIQTAERVGCGLNLLRAYVRGQYGVENVEDLDGDQVDEVLGWLEQRSQQAA